MGIHWDDRSRFHPDRSGIPGLDLISLPLELESVWSRGKVLVFECSKEKEKLYIVSQFGMAGYWIPVSITETQIREKGLKQIVKENKDKHSNFWMVLGDLSQIPEEREKGLYIPSAILFYNDARHFGNLTVTQDLSEIWTKHGPCLMAASLQKHQEKNQGEVYKPQNEKEQVPATLERFTKCITNKRIKNKWIFDFLLEQKHVSGIGNYLCNEILYASKVSPFRILEDLSEEDILNIYENALEIIYQSYMEQGPTDGYIEGGRFQLKVYQQSHDPLGNIVFKDTKSAERTIHYVPNIQI